MKKTAYIHIGLPKTGTSAIQSTLERFFQEKKLQELDMQFHYRDTMEGLNDIRYIKDENFFIEQIRKNILKYSEIGAQDVIISNESYAGALMGTYLALQHNIIPLFVAALKEYNIKLIVYLRRQDIFLESLINQNVKTGCDYEFNDVNLYYKSLLDNCAEYLGKENVIVRKYERESLRGNDVVIDFMHIVGLDQLIPSYLESKGGIANPSLSPSSLRVAMTDNIRYQLDETKRQIKLDEIDKQYQDGVISRSVYTSLARAYFMDHDTDILSYEQLYKRNKLLLLNSNFSYNSNTLGGYFSVEERLKILAKYAEDNAAVAREYYASDDGVLFDCKMPNDVEGFSREVSAADVVNVFMPILINLSERCEKLENRKFSKFNIVRPVTKLLRMLFPKVHSFLRGVYIKYLQ